MTGRPGDPFPFSNVTRMTTTQAVGQARAAVRFDHDLRPVSIETVQVNIGAECNLACLHCHVESSPRRRERMSWATMELVLEATTRLGAGKLDITGGSPELHSDLRRFITGARARDVLVILRTNLTVLLRPELAHLPEFFCDASVHLVASLPCYSSENVEHQRGKGVFEESLAALRRLNEVGYGRDVDLELDLVYNPIGATLPPSQEKLEAAYRRELRERYGIEFTRLFALANMPIGRFAHDLERSGRLDSYMSELRDAFNPRTVPGLMCRSQIHVGWDGSLHDCDFNFVLGMPLDPGAPSHVRELTPDALLRRRIATADHCWGCTAGQGSSCGGALA